MGISLWRRAARPADGDHVQVDGRPVRLAVNPRARRVSLRLDPARREIVAIAPSSAQLREALAFAEARSAWIAARLESLAPGQPFRPGGIIPLHDAPCRLERAAMRIAPRIIASTAAEPARLLASGEGAIFTRGVTRALKAAALDVLSRQTHAVAARLGQPPPQVAVADPRGRWGSCRGARPTEAARIRYNWRLVCAPRDVQHYVVAHECAHLLEPNHGPAFWTLTRGLYGEVTSPRAWLRTNGVGLLALGVEVPSD